MKKLKVLLLLTLFTNKVFISYEKEKEDEE